VIILFGVTAAAVDALRDTIRAALPMPTRLTVWPCSTGLPLSAPTHPAR
jgi:hypothetical protein